MPPRIVIRSLKTNSGFLEDSPVRFSDHLTCIIGGRGTCKSTLIESLRFVFDSDPPRVAKSASGDGIIAKTLGAGSVRCEFDLVDDEAGTHERYVVERETAREPRTSYADTMTTAGDRFNGDVEVYSQGMLQEIAKESGAQLRLQLIDRPNRDKIEVHTRAIDQLTGKLKILGDQSRTLRIELAKRQLQLRDLPQLRAELGRTVDDRPALEPTIGQKHDEYMRRRRTLEILGDLATVQDNIVSATRATLNAHGDLNLTRERLLTVSPLDPRIDVILGALDDATNNLRQAQVEIESVPVRAQIHTLSSEYSALDQDYLAVRQQEQQVTESLKREDHLRRRLSELETVERETTRLRDDQALIEKQRRELRDSISAIRDNIFELRVSEADRINADFGDVVILTMKRATHSAEYIKRLNELLLGSRIRGQEEIATELAERIDNAELLSLIEAGNAQRVATILDRDLGQVTRAVTYLRDHPDLYALESAASQDALNITMFDRGEPKPVEQLSEGQRATALLPLILRHAPCPLVIDQPEDDLDNSFIFEVLVKKIRTLKLRRQLIFVTHNANIPVLGDADSIVVMHMKSATKAGEPRIGNIDSCKDDIIHLLEGGEEAFKSREERYHLTSA